MTSHVTLRVDGQVARVTLSRPEKLNGLTIDMLNGLTAAARHIASDNSIRVVVLSGEGDTFSTDWISRPPGKTRRGLSRTSSRSPGWVPMVFRKRAGLGADSAFR
ncbi:Enoyl-CoA hydratase/isomerase family [Mycobacteroides abscessus]|nr:Enoyl-CoA hydratase/isomerase family [Mycobacteroides abscessus]